MEEKIINTVDQFINILNNKMEDTYFHICIFDEDNEMDLCCEGQITYIDKDKDREGYICIKFGTNNLWLKIKDIIKIERKGTNFFTMDVKNNKYKKIEFRIVFSRVLYKFDFIGNN